MDEEYLYEAVNAEGVRLHGSLNAVSEDAVRMALLDKGLMAVNVSRARSTWQILWQYLHMKKRVPMRELILFSKQFRTLFNAGVSLTEMLRILQNQSENPRLREAVADIFQQVTEGKTLYAGFRRHEDVFSSLYCSMIHAGESSGALGNVLDRLTYLLSHEDSVRKQIASALRYPKMVLISIFLAFMVLLNMVIPQFAAIFKSAKIDLPMPTLVAIQLNELMVQYWWLCLALGGGVVYLFQHWLKTERGALWRDTLALKLPIIGPVVQKSLLARFAAIFSILQRSGVTLLDSIDILCGTLENTAIIKEFGPIKEKLAAGQGFAEPLRTAKYFSPLAINMIAVGESTGNLDGMMEELAKHYDEEVQFAVEGMTEAIGPLLLLGLGIIVLFFALAIFLPMWDMTQLAAR